MQKSRFSVLAMSSFMVVLATVLAGCGGQALPARTDGGTGAESKQGVQQGGAAKISANVTWDTAPEPPPHTMGGIPPADLTSEPKYGGTLLIGSSTGGKMDPHFPSGLWTERWISRVYANGLLEWDLKCNCPKPELAESWKQVDDLTFDFKIRKGIKFHNLPPVNGREMTMQDVKWSFDRLTGAVVSERPKGTISVNYERFDAVKEFQIVDDSTLRMTLKRPDSMILREIMYEYGTVMPKEAMVDGFFNEEKTLIGTGPFVPELVQNTGQSRFKKNPDYWKKDAKGRKLPYLDNVWSLGISAQTAQAAMKSGQAHYILLAYRYGKVFENDPQYRIYNTTNSGVGTSGFWMNTTVKPFDDVRVRRAINLGIDREELGAAVYSPGGYYNWTYLGTWEPYSWSQEKLASMPGYALTGPAKDKEYAEAKKLLAEAGYPNGFEFKCECESVDKAEVFVEQMKRIGLTVKVNKVTSSDMRWTVYMKDKQVAGAYMGGGATPDYALVNYFTCNGSKNLAIVCDQRIEQAIKDFRATTDQQKQVDIMMKIQDVLWDMMPVANDHRAVTYFISYNWVRGWRNHHYDCCWAHGDQVQYTWLDKQ